MPITNQTTAREGVPVQTDGSIILPKTSGTGILVEPAAPTFGWRDITAAPTVRGVGGTDPTLAVYRGMIVVYGGGNQVNASEMGDVFQSFPKLTLFGFSTLWLFVVFALILAERAMGLPLFAPVFG